VWRELSRGTASFRDSVRHIERGSKVLVAYADPDNGDNARDLWLMHAACLAIIERSALVTTAFAVLGKQVMHVRRDYRDRVDTEDGTPPSIRQLLSHTEPTDWDDDPPYWSRWPTDYDYLYILFTDRDYANPDPVRLTPVFAANRFVLYQINGPQLPGAPRAPSCRRAHRRGPVISRQAARLAAGMMGLALRRKHQLGSVGLLRLPLFRRSRHHLERLMPEPTSATKRSV